MRSSKSRSRSKANRPRTLGNIINRVFDSSGPEGKVRGTPQQIIEKYQFLARDAQLSNDRVAAENFNQHAEHYTRMLAEATREMAAEQEARQQQYGQNGNGGLPQHGYGNGNQGGQQGNQPPRDRQPREDRDYRDARDFRQDRSDRDQRHDDRTPMAIDVVETHDDLGLVETPEARPQPQHQPQHQPQPKPRAERPRRDDLPAFVTTAMPQPALSADADAPADRAARRPRAPRKPKDDAPKGDSRTEDNGPDTVA
jgi:hypothetical protein